MEATTILVNGVLIEKAIINQFLIQDKKKEAVAHIKNTATIGLESAEEIVSLFQSGTIYSYDGTDLYTINSVKNAKDFHKEILEKKKGKSKKGFWILGSLAVLFLGYIAWESGFKYTFYDLFRPAEVYDYDNDAATAVESEEDYYEEDEMNSDDYYEFSGSYKFVGDKGYLLKGKLDKQEASAAFNKLPDTLITLEFGDELVAMNPNDDLKNMVFSLSENNDAEGLAYYTDKYRFDDLLAYLKLAGDGKVSFPKFASKEPLDQSLISYYEFNNTFGSNFVDYGLSDLPYGVKMGLMNFYNTSEGSDYKFSYEGNQNSTQLIWNGSLNGKKNKDVALLLKNTEYPLEDRYMLVVFAQKKKTKADDLGYYLIHHENLYSKAILDNIFSTAEGQEFIEMIYMDSSERKIPDNDGIIIKQLNQVDQVLLYNKEFDALKKYVQEPTSIINNEGDEQ